MSDINNTSERHSNPEDVLKYEIKRTALWTFGLSAVTLIILLLLGRETFPAVRGTFFGATFATLNFVLTADAVKRALRFPDNQSRAKRVMFSSYIMRMALLGFVIYVGLTADHIDAWGIIIPLFFPKIAIMARSFLDRPFLRKEGKAWKARK